MRGMVDLRDAEDTEQSGSLGGSLLSVVPASPSLFSKDRPWPPEADHRSFGIIERSPCLCGEFPCGLCFEKG